MTDFGFPVGPLALLDEVRLDVAAKASDLLHEALGERLAPPPILAALVRDGRLGWKSGAGFYSYHRGKRRPNRSVARRAGGRTTTPPSGVDIERRLVLAMINEAARAFADGVVRNARDGAIGAVFGFGFPPFRGGPLRHVDDRGASAVVADTERYRGAVGPRFTPAEILVDMASRGGRFYDERS